MRRVFTVLIFLLSFTVAQGEEFAGHTVVLDDKGKLLSWVDPQSNAYDHVVRLAWNFLLTKVQVEPNGLKSYYTYCCIDQRTFRGTEWPHNPAGFNAMLTDSASEYYAYSGDHRVIDVVKGLLDYQLAHGTTPAKWKWGNMPYASSDFGATEYRGAHEDRYDPKSGQGRGDGVGVIEPDKSAELGTAYLKLYEITGEPRYRDAAIAIGNTLVHTVRRGDDEESPWPFRVYAESGKVREEYASDEIAQIRLLGELVRLKLGQVKDYKKTRDLAWQWVLAVPLKNNVWANYFEDITIKATLWNFNQYSAMETARYLLDHPELDPEWRTHVAGLIAFTEKTFANDIKEGFKGNEWGANAISEQLDYDYKMGSHTSRYASVLARWAEITQDGDAKEKAFRSLNWATYMAGDSGAVKDQPKPGDNGLWFSDGYGDYIRHFLYAMGAQPEWAPPEEDHLLRSTSVIRQVSYTPGQVKYETFDKSATEVLRLSFVPHSVKAGSKELAKRADLNGSGWTFDAKLKVLRIRHTASNSIQIQ
jgi:hypothetical protein